MLVVGDPLDDTAAVRQAHDLSECLSQGMVCGASFRSLPIKRKGLARSLSVQASEPSARESSRTGAGEGEGAWEQ